MTQAYTQQMKRKDEHVGHATQQYQSQSNLELRQTRFVHHPLSEMAVDEVSLQTKMAGFTLETPFFINAITGGSPRTTLINQRLAQLAHETGIAMATGSMSIAMKDSSTAESFTIIRKENPNGIVLANLGAHYTVESAKKAIDLIEANGIQIHVNTLQELVMPEGDRSFHHWLKNIEEIVTNVDVPVIVKEVGFGFSREAMQELINIGVQTIDISGRGGTNFAAIENARREDHLYDELEDWGQTTVQSLVEGYDLSCELIASGGIHSPLDIVKCLALGASAVGMSGEFLHLIRPQDSLPTAIQTVNDWKNQLKNIYTLLGVSKTETLHQTDIILPNTTAHWCNARHIDWTTFANRSRKK